MGTGAEMSPPKREEDSHGPAVRTDILVLPLLSQMIQIMDSCFRNQNEPLSKTTVCARTFPYVTIRRIGCNLGTQVLMPP